MTRPNEPDMALRGAQREVSSPYQACDMILQDIKIADLASDWIVLNLGMVKAIVNPSCHCFFPYL